MNGGGKSSVTLSINDDGTVTLLEGSADIGGTRPSISMQAAEILGLSAEDMFPRIPDTDGVGYTGMTGGSRTTFATGWAAVNAANNLVDELKNRLCMIWEIDKKLLQKMKRKGTVVKLKVKLPMNSIHHVSGIL